MKTKSTFSHMLNEKPASKKVMAEDDMNQIPKGGLKLPKGKVSTYAGILKKGKK